MKIRTFRLFVVAIIALVSTALQCNAQEEKDSVVFIIERMPEYPGGELGLKHDIDSLTTYPQEAIENNHTGSVFVVFVIDREGNITQSRIARGNYSELDKEALTVVNALKQWKPAMQAGRPVEVSYIVRFEFLPDHTIEVKKFAFDLLPPESEDQEKQPVFFIVENMPEYPGGELALRHDITSLIKYPQEAANKGITGTVYVNFIVDKNGQIKYTRIARGVHSSLDKEALRVINALKPWKPGMLRGKPVEVSYTVPISFQQDNKIEVDDLDVSPRED